MIDVYYPYFHRESKWEELRYSLRSLEIYLKEEFRVWIVGDIPPWMNPQSVRYIPHQRSEGMRENATYDAISKMLLFINHPDTGIYFIRMYDDIYLLGDVTLMDIGHFRAMYDHSRMKDAPSGIWWDQLRRTLQAVMGKGYHGWNTETHLPELFNKEKMKWIIGIYHAMQRRLLTSTLYHNTFFPFQQPVMWRDCKAIQFYGNKENEFYTSPTGDLSMKCQGKLLLNHNNAGLNDNLKKFISLRFPYKSSFER